MKLVQPCAEVYLHTSNTTSNTTTGRLLATGIATDGIFTEPFPNTAESLLYSQLFLRAPPLEYCKNIDSIATAFLRVPP